VPVLPLSIYTGVSNTTAPLATGTGYYPLKTSNGTIIASTGTAPMRYTDPTAAMDPEAYGGGAGVGRGVSGGLVVAAAVLGFAIL
jgi:hypothetical protein